MSAKHTPGPWTAKNDGRDIINIQHSNNDPGAISMTLAKVIARMTWRSQSEANARLIAAAPDLLEALNACRLELFHCNQQLSSEGYTTGKTVSDALEQACAAIAKAIG